MIKIRLSILFMLLLLLINPIVAEANTKEIYLRDDLILELLYPLISKEIHKEFHERKQFDCQQVISIKKSSEGSYYFNVDIQLVTFEGPHNPPNYLVNMSFSNSTSNGKWTVTSFKKRLLHDDEKLPCRHPV
ncbi:DUF3888 domain-containing protein [Bacillus sp. JCM 19041]|uniref:DUF3888 domain-containing protein n=1 Tax=Bacillus sp. JCM 19041 TaxID=1460637 RepID=UPI0006D2C2D7